MVQRNAARKVGEKTVKKPVKKGEAYRCSVCGLAVTVDEACYRYEGFVSFDPS